MAVTFDSSIGGDNSTSFVSVEGSSQYFEDTSTEKFSNWSGLSLSRQQQALNVATQYISAKFSWNGGQVVTETQALPWPRFGMYNNKNQYIGQNTIPPEVIAATCELAYLSLDFSGSCPVEQALVPEEGRTTKKEKLDGVGEVEYFSNSGDLSRYFTNISLLLGSLTSQSGVGGLNVCIRRA